MITISLFYCCRKVFVLMNIWMIEKFNEATLPKNKDFYSHLNMDIINADYAQSKRVCKDFEIKNLGEYHDLCVQSNIFKKDLT